jgi:FkbM family methyltransferase
MIDIPFLILDLVRLRGNVRQWIYNMNPNAINPEYFEYLMTKDGLRVRPFFAQSFQSVLGEYQFDDIRKEDIVLDIGAHIGAFTLRAARLSDCVYALEPLFVDKLQENIQLNPELARNITIIEGALGDGNWLSVEFVGRQKRILTYPLKQLIKKCGGHVDFIKIDCEGAEWLIQPEDLKGIRRIELEIHRKIKFPINERLIEYIEQHWNVTHDLKKYPMIGEYIHARSKISDSPSRSKYNS